MSLDEDQTNLSLAQRGFLFTHAYYDRAQVLNTGLSIRLAGVLDETALRRALDALVARHDQLRTTFHQVHGVTHAEPAEHAMQPLAVVELARLGDANAEAELRRIATEEIRHRFDLTTLPLLRATLVRLRPDYHCLILVNHHSTGDGTSFFQIYLKELASLYAAFRKEQPNPLEPLEGRYEDFVAWERERNSGRNLERRVKYWTNAVAGAPAFIDLPTDHARPAIPTGFGGRVEGPAVPGLLGRVARVAEAEEVSPLALLLATFYLLLYRYSGQDDLIVGVPVANRREELFEGVFGCMINTLPIRVRAGTAVTFRDLLRNTHAATFRGFMHMDLAFEKLVEATGKRGDLSRSEIHQVVFNFMPFSPESFALEGLETRVERLFPDATFLDLILEVTDGPRGLGVAANYNADIYDAASIERLVAHYGLLLDGVLDDLGQSLLDYPIVTAEELRLMHGWNAASTLRVPGDVLVHQLFERQVERTPDAVAVKDGTVTLSYRELDRRAETLAAELAARGAAPGTLVAHSTDRSVDLLVGVLGILKTGAAYLPLDPLFPPERLDFMLADSGVRLAVTDESHAVRLVERTTCVVLPLRADSQSARPAVAATPSDLAYVMYTSGSTGKPKAVEITHASVVNFLHGMQHRLKFEPSDRMLAVTTLSFDISILELFLPLMTGGRVVLVERADVMEGGRLAQIIADQAITCMQATPIAYRILLEVGWQGAPNLKALCGGEAFPPDLIEPLTSRCSEVWNMYGPTETTVWSTMARILPGARRALIGHPIANTQVYVLDAALHQVPIGVLGQLYISGAGLARGYRDRPELTAERFIANPFGAGRLYATGDRVRFLADGSLEYFGRNDAQVKIRGYRIELGEIEARMLEVPGVVQAAATVVDFENQGPQLVAYFTATGGVEEEDVRARVAHWLPSYVVLQRCIRLDALPLTPNGKINRGALPPPTVAEERRAPALPPLPRVEDPGQWWWQWEFVPATLAAEVPAFRGNWLIFLDEAGIGQQLATRLRAEGQRVTCVRLADTFQRVSDGEFCVNPELGRGQYDDLVRALVADGGLPERIVHLWSIAIADTFRPGSSSFHQTQDRGSHSVTWLVQALASTALPRKLFVVGNSLCSLRDQRARPESAMLLGINGSINREVRGRPATCIDIELASTAAGVPNAADVLETLYREVAGPGSDTLVVFRGGVRHVRQLRRATPVPCRTLPARGCYVITGGLGQIGQALARNLIDGGARVVLIDTASAGAAAEPISRRDGRSPQLELTGVDVANLRQMGGALAEARRFLGHIDGVFHLASNTRETRLFSSDDAAFDAVLAPRVQGLRVLGELLRRDHTVAFIVSATELDGCTFPQGALASAMADTYVHTACQVDDAREPTLLAVGIGPFSPREAVSAADHAPSLEERIADDSSMRPADAALVLQRAAACGEASLFASTVDLASWCARIEDASSVGERTRPRRLHVPPSTPLQRRLAQLFCEVLGLPQVSATDSFFDLGGHSLLAVRLFGRIEAEFSVELPLATVFKAPSVQDLANVIKTGHTTESTRARSNDFRYLVRLQEGAVRKRSPLFVAAGAFGNVLNLRHLAALTAGTRDFYGLQARGLVGGDLPHHSFQEAAAAFLEEIRRVQPEGPYLLGGFCSGGITALEMARLLRRNGEAVPLVVLFDTVNPAALTPLELSDRVRIHLDGTRKGGLKYVTQHAKQRFAWELGRVRTALGARPEPPRDSALYRSEAVFKATEVAMKHYRPTYYDGAVVLFRPPLNRLYEVSGGRGVNDQRELVFPDGGWQHWVRTLEVHEVAGTPGDHDGFVLEPYVRDLATRLHHHLSLVDSE